MRGNPIGSHWSTGSLESATGTCLTPGPEGLFAFNAANPKGVYGKGCTIPVSSGRPPSAPAPASRAPSVAPPFCGNRAGCSNAPFTWNPPSNPAASQIPDRSRRGAGAELFAAYAALRGGILFHFLASCPVACGAAFCTRRLAESVNPAMRTAIERAKRLDISKSLRQLDSDLSNESPTTTFETSHQPEISRSAKSLRHGHSPPD